MDEATLRGLVELTRFCPSGANRQSLKYHLAWTPEENATIFQHLGWAKWLADWDGPAEGERPAGYIVILGDTELSEHFDCDAAIAAHTILLGATELGLGGCMIAWIDHEAIVQTFGISERYQVLMVVALGCPKESIVLDEATDPHDIAYWRDADGIHHVPKRPLGDLLVDFDRDSHVLQPVLAGLK